MTVHNRKKNTLECLRLLYNQKIDRTQYLTDVFFTDDGCTDGTAEAVQKEFPDVHIIEGDGNLFWNKGMYEAWKVAAATKQYGYYFWLNDDTYIYDDALNELLKASSKFEDEAIVVGSACAIGNRNIITYGGRENGKIIKPSDGSIECKSFNGNLVLIPRAVFDKVGYNDNYYTHNFGDVEYGLRAARHGVKSYIIPGIIGECDRHEKMATWCDPKKSFNQRWQAFHTPLGPGVKEGFHFEAKYVSLFTAIFHYITKYIRLFVPIVWIKLNKTKL